MLNCMGFRYTGPRASRTATAVRAFAKRVPVTLLLAGLASLAGAFVATEQSVASAAATQPKASAVSVAFSPSEINIVQGDSQPVVLLITNGGTVPITQIKVSYFYPHNIAVANPGRVPAELRGGTSAAIPLTVDRRLFGPPESFVEAVVTFSVGNGSKMVHSSLTTSLKVSPATALVSQSAITVTASVGTADLVQYQSTDVFYTITNTSQHQLQLDSVVLNYPSFLNITCLSKPSVSKYSEVL